MPFMISIDGYSAPCVEHPTLGQAINEAHRLSRQPSTFKRKIRILKEVAVVDNVSPHFLSHLKFLDRNETMTVGEILDLIQKYR